MAKDVQIVIPTYGRPKNIRQTAKQLKGHQIFFVCHHTDTESQRVVKSLGYEPVIDYQPPSGVNATNAGYWATDSKWVVIGQDDFSWTHGWLDKAWQYTNQQVIGFNDGYIGRRPEHSVGWLVNADFIKAHSLAIGFPNVIFFPHYKKNYSDNELCDTARDRGVWAYAYDALVEHLHPSFGKSEDDETYTHLEKHLSTDYELYNSRRYLWHK